MSTVTTSGNSFIFKHTYSNGVVITAKFGADQATFISYSDSNKVRDLTTEERMEVDDELQRAKVKSLKDSSKSDFLVKNVIAVQGGDVLEKIFKDDTAAIERIKKKYNLTETELATEAMSMDYRKSLSPIPAGGFGPSKGSKDNVALAGKNSQVVREDEIKKDVNLASLKREATDTLKNKASAIEVEASNLSGPNTIPVSYTKTDGDRNLPAHIRTLLGLIGEKIVPGQTSNRAFSNMNDIVAKEAGYKIPLATFLRTANCSFLANFGAVLRAQELGIPYKPPQEGSAAKDGTRLDYSNSFIQNNLGRIVKGDASDPAKPGDSLTFDPKNDPSGYDHFGWLYKETDTYYDMISCNNVIKDEAGNIVSADILMTRVLKSKHKPIIQRLEKPEKELLA